MDWVDRPQNGFVRILQLLQGSQLDNFLLKTLKLDWVTFHAVTVQLKYLDFQSNQYKKLVPALSRSLAMDYLTVMSSRFLSGEEDAARDNYRAV